jgi:hypothetical protein
VAHAGLVTYPNSGSWNAAVTGIANVAIPDPGPSGFTTIGTGTASVTYGSVVFSTSAALSNGTFYDIGASNLPPAIPAVLSSQQQTTGLPNILVTFPNPVEAFSLAYGTFNGTAVTFTLSNGDTFTQGSTGSSYAVPDFAGATDTTPFTSVLITTPGSAGDTNALNLNDVSFGSLVPEPASLVLSALGAIGLLAFGRRKR